jgi:hypothetical protein
VIDATGAAWNTYALYETMMTINLFGPVLLALLAVTKLARYQPAAQRTGSRGRRRVTGPARCPLRRPDGGVDG